MAARVTPERQDQVAEPIEGGWSYVEPRGTLDKPERLDPARHTVEVTELLLEGSEDRQARRAGGFVRLLDRHLRADAASDQQPVSVERPVTGDVCRPVVDTHEFERQLHTRWSSKRSGQHQAEFRKPILDGS